MAKKKKTSTVAKVGQTIAGAAKVVASTAGEYVVEPVGKAVGLIKGKKSARKKAPAKKVAAKSSAKKKPAPRTKKAAKK
jgi:hypothetical protein